MDCTKTTRQWTVVPGLQLARQLDSREDIVRVIVAKVVDSAFGFFPSQVSVQESERASKLTSSLPLHYLGHVPQTG